MRGTVQYGYDPVHGRLKWVEGLGVNSRFDFHYNAERQLEAMFMPSGIVETLSYDTDGQLRTRNTWSPPAGWFQRPDGYLRADTMRYDARGKITTPTVTWIVAHGINHRTPNVNVYDGNGHLVESQDMSSPTGGESLTADSRCGRR